LAYYHEWIESILNFKSLTSFTIATTTDSIKNLTTTYECNVFKVSCGCSIENVVLSSMRIIGDEEAVPHSWAMAVSIRLNDSEEHSCSGSILTQSYILTSAHCIDGASLLGISVEGGMHNRIEDFALIRYVHEIYIHPNWNGSDGTYRNDIALLYIFPPLPANGFGNFARTCVPYVSSLDETVNYPLNDSHLAVIGWGSTEYGSNDMSDTLQQASIHTIDNNDPICLQSIHDIEKQFCAGMQGRGNEKCLYSHFEKNHFLYN
jgi:secreted trypsin-like serine protease